MQVWDYIILGTSYPSACGVSLEALNALRREFEYWYPLDLRVSGKDLIGNHLTMSLYNHAAVWQVWCMLRASTQCKPGLCAGPGKPHARVLLLQWPFDD